MTSTLRLLFALALLLAAAMLGSPTPPSALLATSEGEHAQPIASPYDALLSPLAPGPRSVLGLALWMSSGAFADPKAPTQLDRQLALTLLEQAPDLEGVRLEAVDWFVNLWAPSERDDARHRALVTQGLGLLEEGLVLHPSTRLYAALGRTLAEPATVRSRDPRRAHVAELLFGERSTDMAISALRHAAELPREGVLLADLLFDRGKQSLERYRDLSSALQDFKEAQALYSAVGDARDVQLSKLLGELAELEDPAELRRS